jgi:hypothetical protein
MANPIHQAFSDVLTVRCQPWLTDAVNGAAARKGQKAAEYVRQALLFALRADGVKLELDQQYGLVRDGAFLGPTTFQPVADDRGEWLPIENEDSEPFDATRHWRGTPTYRVDGARLVRLYPVVSKSLEQA